MEKMENSKKRRQYLLDTNVLVRRPRLLSRSDAKEIFLIPLASLGQLSSQGHGTTVGPLQRVLSAAANSGVEVVDPSGLKSPLVSAFLARRLDNIDHIILGALQKFKSDLERDVVLVTDDGVLRRAALEVGLEAISLNELEQLLDQDGSIGQSPINFEVNNEVDEYEKSERSNMQIALAIGGVAIALAVIAWRCYPGLLILFAKVPEYVIFGGALLFGAVLYTFRQRFRFSYGMLEAVVGAIIAVKSSPPHLTLDIVSGLQILGGLYVVVRGLDNIGTGLKDTRYAPNWKLIFG